MQKFTNKIKLYIQNLCKTSIKGLIKTKLQESNYANFVTQKSILFWIKSYPKSYPVFDFKTAKNCKKSQILQVTKKGLHCPIYRMVRTPGLAPLRQSELFVENIIMFNIRDLLVFNFACFHAGAKKQRHCVVFLNA